MKKRVRVVGSGPAGLCAAEVLTSAGFAVEIIDHHKSPARKFLLAGRGGLNLTHSEPLDYFLNRYGRDRAFLEPAIRDFPPDAVREWAKGLGVETFIGSSGRVFPVGLRASPLLRAWMRRLDERGVTLKSNTPWNGFDDVPTILALGGASWPELGSDAAWVKIFETSGIRVNSLQPSNGRQLVTWSEHFATRFAGTPIKNVSVTVRGQKVRGEIMITRDGIEGGAVYALSRALRESGAQSLSLDLKPEMTAEMVTQRLAWPRGKETRTNFLRKALGLAPVGISLLREVGHDDPKNIVITLQGPAEIRRAISTAGGVAKEEVDENFRLNKYPNTYVVGEMLDWDAPTGGYLLQACFSTAHKAATAMVRELQN